VEVNAQGSDAALKELLDGQIDLAAIGRPLTEQEKAQGLVQVPLSRQKIAIIVGPDNPYKGDITFDKFAGIFRGQITNWSQIGGPPVPIVLIDRPESSDTRRAFKSYQVFQTAPFKTGANAKPISQDSTIEVIKQLGKNGIGYAIADQVMDRQDVHIIRMHKVLPDSPKYPFSQTLSYVYKQSNPNPGIPLYLGFATASSNQQIVKEAIANTTTAPAAPQPAPSQPAQTAKPTDPGMSSTLIKGGGETGTSEAGFPWWLVLLLGIPLLGGLLWWLLKSGRPQAGSPVDAIPPTDKPSTLPPTVVAPVPPPPSSRLFLVPYDGKNAYAYWEIVPAQLEAVQRGGES
jgi:phosphate transport system substrate-binding protein